MSTNAIDLVPDTSEITSTDVAISLLSENALSHYKNIDPKYFEMSDNEMEDIAHPTKVDRMLKINFWKEVKRAKLQNRTLMNYAKVYNNICSKTYWHDFFIKTPAKFAFILRPPMSYEEQASELVEFGLKRLRDEVLTARFIFEDTGHIDSKGVGIVLKVIEYFDARMRGAIQQKIQIDQRTQNVNVNMNENDLGHQPDLQKEIEKIREQLSKAKNAVLVENLPERVVSEIEAMEIKNE